LPQNQLELRISAKAHFGSDQNQVLIFVAATGGQTHHTGALNALNVRVEAANGHGYDMHHVKTVSVTIVHPTMFSNNLINLSEIFKRAGVWAFFVGCFAVWCCGVLC
jgi:hypothetical protein